MAARTAKAIANLGFNDITDHASMIVDVTRAWEDRYFELSPKLRPVLRRAKARYGEGRRFDFTLARRVALTEAVREVLRLRDYIMPVVSLTFRDATGRANCMEVWATPAGKLRIDGKAVTLAAAIKWVMEQLGRITIHHEGPFDLRLHITGILLTHSAHEGVRVCRDGMVSTTVTPLPGEEPDATFARAAACYLRWELQPGREVPDVGWKVVVTDDV